MTEIVINLCAQAYSGFQESTWALGMILARASLGFIGLLAYLVRAQHQARAHELGPRPVSALGSMSLNFSRSQSGLEHCYCCFYQHMAGSTL